MRTFVHGSLALLTDDGERSSEHRLVLFVNEGNVTTQDTLLQDTVVLTGVNSFLKHFVVLDTGLCLE